MKKWEGGLEANYLTIPRKDLLQPKIPSHPLVHFVKTTTFMNCLQSTSIILLQLPSNKLLISKQYFLNEKRKELNYYESYNILHQIQMNSCHFKGEMKARGKKKDCPKNSHCLHFIFV